MPVLTKINSNVIADDAITGDKLGGSAYLANTATQNISGTYSENRMYTSDAYTLSGNATVNSELILSSVKPNADAVLTASGAYTITGTGTLSGGSMYGRNTVSGMTGELGSTVTGTPAITEAPALIGLGTVTSGTYNSVIGTSATFPAGHVIQVTGVNQASTHTDCNTGNNAWDDTVVRQSITPKFVSSKIIVYMQFNIFGNNTTGDAGYSLRVNRKIGGVSYYPANMTTWGDGSNAHTAFYKQNDTGEFVQLHNFINQDPDPNTTSEIDYRLEVAEYNCESIQAGGAIGNTWKVFIMEVSG